MQDEAKEGDEEKRGWNRDEERMQVLKEEKEPKKEGGGGEEKEGKSEERGTKKEVKMEVWRGLRPKQKRLWSGSASASQLLLLLLLLLLRVTNSSVARPL